MVQLNVWTGTEWVNIFDGNDFTNTQADLHRVAKVVETHTSEIQDATKTASDAVKAVDSAVSVSKVNSDAIAAQNSAISEAKIALDSATAEIQQTASNAASDAANIRADVARVESEVASVKSASQDSINTLQSDIDTTKKDLADTHSGLLKAQAAVEQNQKLITDSVAKINNDIAQDRADIEATQQANADTAKKLDSYTNQATEQGKAIKDLQANDDSMKLTIADINGNVSQVQDSVTGLTASLKDTQGNLATVKSLADSLNATITDHSKNISTLQATAQSLSSTLSDADGRLSKVEQTAEEQSTTLSTVQGNLSQVKQTAAGLVTTLKDAQGNISQLQQTAKGTAEQISDIQGDITTLQTDVTGVKATIADNENDIHTLQADSKTLKDNMADANGNISSLQKTSTSLTSEMQDHDGRLSKVEQTANGTQQTVANQQGQINTIKTDADGIHQTLTGQGNQIATINTTLDGLNTKYEGVSGDLGKLKNQAQWVTITSAVDLNSIKTPCHEFLKGTATNAPNELAWWYLTVESSDDSSRVTQTVIADQSNNRYTRRWNNVEWSAWVKDATRTDITALSDRITTNSTQITQNKQVIALKADQSTVNNLSGEVSQNTSTLKIQADQISSKVSSEDFNTLDNKVGGAIAQIDKNTTAIDQTNKQISLKADQTTVDALNDKVSSNASQLTLLNNEIQSKVDSSTVNNLINNKGFVTQQVAQSLIDQKADTITESITGLSQKVDNNNQAAVDKIQQITASIDGVQSIVKDKANQSQVTQLANALQIKMTGATIANASDVTLTYTGKDNEYPPAAPLVGMNNVGKGSTLILSFDYVASADTKLTPQLDGDPWIPWGNLVNATPATKGEKGSYSMTITVNDDSWQKGDAKNVCIRCDGFKGTIEITNLVLKYADTVHDVQSTFDMLRDDINLRVTKGDLISQINLEAGGDGLISVQNGKGKLMLDAGSVVFGNKAFIPSAAITNIQADKITSGTLDAGNIRVINLTADNIRGGTLDVGNMHVKNFSANDIEAGTLSGVTIRAGDTTGFFQTSKDNIYWFTNNGDQSAVIGKGTYVDFPGFNIFDSRAISLGTYTGSYLQNGTIEDNGGSIGHPQFNIELPADSAFNLLSKTGERTAPLDNARISGWVGPNEFFSLEQTQGFKVELNPDLNTSQFSIQKDYRIGAYFGSGNNGNQINLITVGTGQGVNVTGDFHVTGAKNSIVNTKQGYLAINAYETAEYYFGDIGESNTGEACQVTIGIDQIFNETVNTDITYQVFVTPYSDARVWVEKRYNNRFVVKSDKPNAEFGWELKAKRKGYESNRLRRVSVDVNPLQLKGETK